MAATIYEIKAYSNGGLSIVEKIINPSPKTMKLDKNVNEFLKLLSLSYYYAYIYTTLSRTS